MPPSKALVRVHAPRPDAVTRARRRCPTCQRSVRMLGTHVPWYGWTFRCCECGDGWDEGGRLPRPFERGWRKRYAALALAQYKEIARAKH